MMKISASFLVVCLAFAPVARAEAPAKTGGKDPVEITSDQLEVFQEENRAVFTGHVVAVQGNMRMTSDVMHVYYATAEEKAQGIDSIKKIAVKGNVFLATPDETASGADGDYDAIKREIHLNNNVVLTRGDNTLKGDRLTHNLDTGKTVVNGGEAASGSGQRVRALFIPNSKDKNKDKKPANKP